MQKSFKMPTTLFTILSIGDPRFKRVQGSRKTKESLNWRTKL